MLICTIASTEYWDTDPSGLKERSSLLCGSLYCGRGANYKRLLRNKNTFPFSATITESGVSAIKGVIFHSQFWKSDGRGQLSFGVGASTRWKRNFDFVTMAGYLTRFEDFYKVKSSLIDRGTFSLAWVNGWCVAYFVSCYFLVKWWGEWCGGGGKGCGAEVSY